VLAGALRSPWAAGGQRHPDPGQHREQRRGAAVGEQPGERRDVVLVVQRQDVRGEHAHQRERAGGVDTEDAPGARAQRRRGAPAHRTPLIGPVIGRRGARPP
jgi:hypothetical protein